MKKIKSIILILIVAIMFALCLGLGKGATILGGSNGLIDPVPIPFSSTSNSISILE